MKKTKQFIILIILCLVLVIGGPLFVIASFHVKHPFVFTSLEEKDILSYYTSLLGLSLTITTFWLAYKQTIKRIIHTQTYNRQISFYELMRNQIDEKLDKANPLSMKRFQLISDSDAQKYYYSLSYHFEEYKITVKLSVDSIILFMRDTVNDSFWNGLDIPFISTALENFKEKALSLAGRQLDYYYQLVTCEEATIEDYPKEIQQYNEQINQLYEDYIIIRQAINESFNQAFSNLTRTHPERMS